MVATLRGLWLEVRVIPVLLWSFSALTVGTALAAHGGDLKVWYYVGAVALGALIQGLLAHSVNEIADWRFTPGKITQALMADYTAEVQPKGKKAAA